MNCGAAKVGVNEFLLVVRLALDQISANTKQVKRKYGVDGL